jgi:hypothetical protein
MRTVSKVALFVVLLCLLAARAEAGSRRSQMSHNDKERQTMRVRRSRQSNPTRRPFVSNTKAALPPEDDEDGKNRPRSRSRFAVNVPNDSQENANSQQFLRHVSTHQSIPEKPRYRTLCLLLI